MTNEQIRIAVAEACGFRDIKVRSRYNGIQDYDALCGELDGIVQELPNYHEDLNAMNEAECLVTVGQMESWIGWIQKLAKPKCGYSPFDMQFFMIHATARQRAEAFLRTLNKWKD